MPLYVYEQTSPGVYSSFSLNGDFTNPITSVIDGRQENVEIFHLYIGADDTDHTYTTISLKPQCITGDDVGDGTNPGTSGWGVKVLEDSGYTPSEEEWSSTVYGGTLSFEDIVEDDSTKQGFWVRFESPAGQIVQNKTNIVLSLIFVDEIEG